MEMARTCGVPHGAEECQERGSEEAGLDACRVSVAHPATAPVQCALHRLRRLISPQLACASHRLSHTATDSDIVRVRSAALS